MTKPVTWAPSARSALDRLQGKLFATTTEVAAVFGYDRRTVMKGIEAGEIPSCRVGSTYRVPTAWIFEQAGVSTGVGT